MKNIGEANWRTEILFVKNNCAPLLKILRTINRQKCISYRKKSAWNNGLCETPKQPSCLEEFPGRSSNKRRVAVISAKNHKRQRRKRQPVTAKREKSQTPKVLTAILLPNLN